MRPETLGRGFTIAATGCYLPEDELDNARLIERGFPGAGEDIEKLTGIRSRHVAAPSQATSDLGIAAARDALRAAGAGPEAVQRLVVSTCSPDHLIPSTACLIGRELELGPVPAFDIAASCAGFLYALEAAGLGVLAGDELGLVVSSEIRTRFVDPRDRATGALFGDGAGAAVVVPCEPGTGVLAVGLASDGKGADDVILPGGGSREPASADTVAAGRHRLHMQDGARVYLAASEGMARLALRGMEALELDWSDVALLVPHQPNRRVLDRMARLAKVPEGKLFDNLATTGNISSASCLVALHEALRQGRAGAGDKVLLVAAGAGHVAGLALLEVDERLAESARRDRKEDTA